MMTMKALLLKEFGWELLLEEIPRPVPGPEDVLIRVKACAVDQFDLTIREGKFPTARLPVVLRNTSGFVYYVSVLGITGTKSAAETDIRYAVERLQRHTTLPVAVGFGIRTADAVRDVAATADAAVVGSAIVDRIVANLDENGRPSPHLVGIVHDFVRELAEGVRS